RRRRPPTETFKPAIRQDISVHLSWEQRSAQSSATEVDTTTRPTSVIPRMGIRSTILIRQPMEPHLTTPVMGHTAIRKLLMVLMAPLRALPSTIRTPALMHAAHPLPPPMA